MNNDAIWKDDKLGRQGDADFLQRLLESSATDLRTRGIARSYVLNLDSGWGRGKTFFLTRLKQQLEASGHLVAYVNAWEDDFAEDPLTAVMAAIDEVVIATVPAKGPAIQAWEKTKKKAGQVAYHVVKGVALKGAGLLLTDAVAGSLVANFGKEDAQNYSKLATEATNAIEKVIDEKTQQAINDFTATKRTINAFRGQLSVFLDTITSAKEDTMFFVLVDELDRCRPPYAIAMLERIKHLFSVPNAVFLIATDSEQLQHSVGAVYGAEFDSQRYLKRFFDNTFQFEEPNVRMFVGHQTGSAPFDFDRVVAPYDMPIKDFMADFYFFTNTDLRAIEQIHQRLRAIVLSWGQKVPLQLTALLPLLLLHYRGKLLPPTDEGFSKALQGIFVIDGKLNAKKHGAKASSGDERMRPFMDNFWAVAQSSLPNIVGNETMNVWLRDQFVQEFSLLHGDTSTRGSELRSLVTTYPSIVRRAGRLEM